MDWVGQLDNLTKLLVLLFLGLAATVLYLWITIQDKDVQIYQLTREKGFAQRDLGIVTDERNQLLTDIAELVALVDQQDRDSGTMWGPARSKIEELRQRRMT